MIIIYKFLTYNYQDCLSFFKVILLIAQVSKTNDSKLSKDAVYFLAFSTRKLIKSQISLNLQINSNLKNW